MQYVYVCKYCQSVLGRLNDSEISSASLGLAALTLREREDIISFDFNRNFTYVKTVCDYCQSAIEQHPELILQKSPLQ